MTSSGRFASYVTNGLGERREGERDLLNEREEKSSGAFTSHGRLRFRVRTPKRNTNTNLGRYCGRLLLSAEASSQTGDAESPQVGLPSFYFTLLLLLFFFLLLTCRVFTEKQHPGRAAMRARDGLSNFCRPPPPGCSLITFFIAANLKFRFAALPLLTMTFVACCRGDRMLALFWCGNGANSGQGDNLYQELYNPVGAVFFLSF